MKMLMLASVATMGASAVNAETAPGPSRFEITANAFSQCMRQAVQMGMTVKTDPAKFKVGFATMCKPEETEFRTAAIAFAMTQGRTEPQAIAEIDGNIANGRRVFAADQESYVLTGRVPR